MSKLLCIGIASLLGCIDRIPEAQRVARATPADEWVGDYVRAPGKACPAGRRCVQVELDYLSGQVVRVSGTALRGVLRLHLPARPVEDRGTLFTQSIGGETMSDQAWLHLRIQPANFQEQPLLLRVTDPSNLFVEPVPGG